MASVDKRVVRNIIQKFVQEQIKEYGSFSNFINHVKEKARVLNVAPAELMSAKLEYHFIQVMKTKIEIHCGPANVIHNMIDFTIYAEDKIFFVRISEWCGETQISVGRVVLD